MGWIATDLGARFPGDQFQAVQSTLEAHDKMVEAGKTTSRHWSLFGGGKGGEYGSGSKLNHQETTDLSPSCHLPGFQLYPFLTHTGQFRGWGGSHFGGVAKFPTIHVPGLERGGGGWGMESSSRPETLALAQQRLRSTLYRGRKLYQKQSGRKLSVLFPLQPIFCRMPQLIDAVALYGRHIVARRNWMTPARSMRDSCQAGYMAPFLGAVGTFELYSLWLFFKGWEMEINRDAGDFFLGKQFLPKDRGGGGGFFSSTDSECLRNQGFKPLCQESDVFSCGYGLQWVATKNMSLHQLCHPRSLLERRT